MMTDGAFSKEFDAAMARVRELRGEGAPEEPALPAQPQRRLLRRSALMQHQMPNTNFAIFHFLGWVHTRGG